MRRDTVRKTLFAIVSISFAIAASALLPEPARALMINQNGGGGSASDACTLALKTCLSGCAAGGFRNPAADFVTCHANCVWEEHYCMSHLPSLKTKPVSISKPVQKNK